MNLSHEAYQFSCNIMIFLGKMLLFLCLCSLSMFIDSAMFILYPAYIIYYATSILLYPACIVFIAASIILGTAFLIVCAT